MSDHSDRLVKTFEGDVASLQLLASLTKGLDFTIPDINLSDPKYAIPQEVIDLLKTEIKPITVDAFTSKQVDGTGVFDVIMSSLKIHLKEEFENNRITGSEYTQAYIQLTQTAMQTALELLLSKNKALLEALTTQINGITALVTNANARISFAIAQAQAHTQKAQYANEVLKLASGDAQYGNLLETTNLTNAQTAQVTAQTGMVPAQTSQIEAQTAQVTKQIDKLNKDIEHVSAQIEISKEQKEQVRAQTLDTRTDGSKIQGTISRNNALIEQQKESFKRKDESNAARFWTDWMSVAKAQDSGIETPSSLTNLKIDEVLTKIRKNLNI